MRKCENAKIQKYENAKMRKYENAKIQKCKNAKMREMRKMRKKKFQTRELCTIRTPLAMAISTLFQAHVTDKG